MTSKHYHHYGVEPNYQENYFYEDDEEPESEYVEMTPEKKEMVRSMQDYAKNQGISILQSDTIE